MARKWAAIGTQLWIGDTGSPELFNKVASLGDISGPKKKRDTIDTTTHDVDTTDGGYKTFITSLKDGQEFTAVCFLDPNEATHNSSPTVVGTFAGGLDYLFDKGDVRDMYVVHPVSPASRIQLKAAVIGLDFEAKVKDALMFNATFKVSGKPTLQFGLTNGNPNIVFP